MRKFYHITKKAYLASILKNGLKPSAETGIQNTYMGLKGDPNFVYFETLEGMLDLKKDFDGGHYNREIWNEDSVLLEVSLSEKHPVERDMDQLLVMWAYNEPDRGKYYKKYFEEVFGLQFILKPTKENIIEFCKKEITEEMWNKNGLPYRSAYGVPPSCLKIITLEDITQKTEANDKGNVSNPKDNR
jgi:hypothetical protein